MHMTAYTGKVPWPSSRHWSRVGALGGNDKLAIDKGGNLPEKVENHWFRPIATLYMYTCTPGITRFFLTYNSVRSHDIMRANVTDVGPYGLYALFLQQGHLGDVNGLSGFRSRDPKVVLGYVCGKFR